MQPKVTLLSWTKDPMETIYLLWEASRKKSHISTVDELKHWMQGCSELREDVRSTFMQVLTSRIPVSENINFVFLLENVSVAFREQMVRHRVGVKVGERLGVDMVPDLHDSTWWSQTMRVIDMGEFANNDAYHTPKSIDGNEDAAVVYHETMSKIEAAYRAMCKLGIPPEDARMVIPMAAEHRISWGMNLATLAHIISKRSCWIAQLGLWEPIIAGMIEEVCTKVDPVFSALATPPCMRGNEFKGCLHPIDCDARVAGTDPGIPCPLHVHYGGHAFTATNSKYSEFVSMKAKYQSFWRRDVNTGASL